MATCPGGFNASPVKGTSKCPVLPPIGGSRRGEEADQTAAVKQKILSVPQKLLKHRRSEVQQQQTNMILYVFSSTIAALLSILQ